MRWNNLFIFALPCLHPKLNSLLCPIIYVSINLSSPLVASFDQENLKRQECLILLRMSIPMKNIYNSKKLDSFCLFLFKTTQIKVLKNYLQMHVLLSYFPFYSKHNTLTQTKLWSSYFFLSSFSFFFQL